jgi:nucleotide-binding universal stress UspA family protein
MADLKQQIFIIAHPNYFPEKGFHLACELGKAYKKDVCFLGIPQKSKMDVIDYVDTFTRWIKERETDLSVKLNQYTLDFNEDFNVKIEQAEDSIVVFEIAGEKFYNKPAGQLEMCRQLRIPYFFVKQNQHISFEKVLVPVGFLNEEREKGPMSGSLGRYFDSEILLMPAKDYGSRARKNTEAIRTLLDKLKFRYKYIDATKDSSKVELEAARKTDELGAGMLLISASRDYGLDDILFGSKELKVIKKATVPVMVINPRKDLYTLCG